MKLALCFLGLLSMAWAAPSSGRRFQITSAEARLHKLPPLGFAFQLADGYPALDPFPQAHVYFRNQPSPPGGAYAMEMTEYSDYPNSDEGLRRWSRDWCQKLGLKMEGQESIGSVPVGERQMRAVSFITGISHARSQHLVLLFPLAEGQKRGAALLLTWGPDSSASPSPTAFAGSPAFAVVLKTLVTEGQGR
ncbi:MAG: hypothetical protein U0931_25955 [Vulcanimicrobiota bacterium]